MAQKVWYDGRLTAPGLVLAVVAVFLLVMGAGLVGLFF